MTICQTITSHDDVMTFGKYKGKAVDWIADKDPSYIVWLAEEQIVTFPKDILQAAQRIVPHYDPFAESWGWVD